MWGREVCAYGRAQHGLYKRFIAMKSTTNARPKVHVKTKTKAKAEPPVQTGPGRRRIGDELTKIRNITLDNTDWGAVRTVAAAVTGEPNVSGLMRHIAKAGSVAKDGTLTVPKVVAGGT